MLHITKAYQACEVKIPQITEFQSEKNINIMN